MFNYDNGLFLTRSGLAVDVQRPRPRAFVSHAHADHLARHQVTYCTPATGRLFQLRRGVNQVVRNVRYGQPWDLPGLNGGVTRLTAFPAGHTLGSAMLLVEEDGLRLLYSGDCSIGPSLTSEPLEPVSADVFILECTYGRPRYRLPSRDETLHRFLLLIDQAFQKGRTPVVHGYALGRLQEVAAILADAGIPTQHEDWVYQHSCIYQAFGVDLGRISRYDGIPRPGHVVLLPKRSQLRRPVAGLKRTTTFILSGWAIDPDYATREQVDYALPLSDHCDYDQLFQLVERVRPRRLYCTHGPESIVDDFRLAGYDAHYLPATEVFDPQSLQS